MIYFWLNSFVDFYNFSAVQFIFLDMYNFKIYFRNKFMTSLISKIRLANNKLDLIFSSF